jgi:hypothetical protein
MANLLMAGTWLSISYSILYPYWHYIVRYMSLYVGRFEVHLIMESDIIFYVLIM